MPLRNIHTPDRVNGAVIWTLCDGVHTMAWGYRHLRAFVEREGHARVPRDLKTTEGYALGDWVGKQRLAKDQLLEDRIARLESPLGWVWDMNAFRWEKGFSYLEAFVGREGHARVPNRFKTDDGYLLGSWAGNQRINREKLSADRITCLESLPGWAWKTRIH